MNTTETKKVRRYTVVTSGGSRLGRWLRSENSAKRIAEIWAGHGMPGTVKVYDDRGLCVYSVAS
jgi:hypothetical protein